eukprot:6185857-Pleurochrysis_carterae.AAC.5
MDRGGLQSDEQRLRLMQRHLQPPVSVQRLRKSYSRYPHTFQLPQEARSWQAPSGEKASDSEVRFLAPLLVARVPDSKRKEWVEAVLLEESSYLELDVAWASPTRSPAWSAQGVVQTTLTQSLTWEADVLHAAARVMCEGSWDGHVAALLPTLTLHNYVSKLKAKTLLGTKREGSKRPGAHRQVAEAVRVARMLRERGHALKRAYAARYEALQSGPRKAVAELAQVHEQEKGGAPRGSEC